MSEKLEESQEISSTGLTHECGVFGVIACGEWPAKVNHSF